MIAIDDAILALLTFWPETAKDLVVELRQWTEGGIYKGPPWQPGDVLSALDRLCLTGKAELVKGEGYRRVVERKGEAQRGLFR